MTLDGGGDRAAVAGLDQVVSADGWPYASSSPVGPGDPGRFHALFGRDSLITSLQLLPVRPQVAIATLRALAAAAGTTTDGATCEEPGKIGHEFRAEPPAIVVAAGWPPDRPFRYFASADATAWFLVTLDATIRVTGRADLLGELEPVWRGACGWLRRTLETGRGLVRHRPGTRAGGLTQQGWRDSRLPLSGTAGNGILRADGTVPTPPLADTDTQAVTVAALHAAGRLTGEPEWARRAHALRALLTRAFLPDVMAIEAGDRPVLGAGSQLGWLLWADAVVPQAISAVADRLCGGDITTPYGLRTLSADAMTFDPHAYHRGSVWPFDSWLGWGGLRAAGRRPEAEQLRCGVLEAVRRLGGFPELYAVSPSGQLQSVPAANRVQAWTVGACWALENGWDGRSDAVT